MTPTPTYFAPQGGHPPQTKPPPALLSLRVRVSHLPPIPGGRQEAQCHRSGPDVAIRTHLVEPQRTWEALESEQLKRGSQHLFVTVVGVRAQGAVVPSAQVQPHDSLLPSSEP